jgi:hypothetical protein
MFLLKKLSTVGLTFCLLSTGQASSLDQGLTLLTSAHGQAIYTHLLEHHWVPQTGLFASFPDSQDATMAQQSSTYEQAAMGLLALQLGDEDRTERLLEFFKRTWDVQPHGFMNFYNTDFGSSGIEKTVHAGPNAWVGLFAARFANRKENPDALTLALNVGYWMANSLPHKNGAIAMGISDTPQGAPWTRIYSTENNISYYAFLSELLKSSHLDAAQRQLFTTERFAAENWLLNKALDRTTYEVHRGEISSGMDSKYALDTVTWLISAIGCKRLTERGIDIVRLLTVAGHHFEVTVKGQLGVDPADQKEADLTFMQDHAPAKEAKRPAKDQHRMIWYEGLGQYVLALTAAAQYLEEKGQADQARLFLEKITRLQKAFDAAAISHIKGQAAYPYATPGRFFTDGWRTPEPAVKGPASSLIAGIWRLFAGLGVDPLSGEALHTVSTVQISVPRHIQLASRDIPIYRGTSEDMTSHAWAQLNTGHWDEAINQAQATIEEWSGWAAKLEDKKSHEAKGLLPYTGTAKDRQAIFNYWALNDIGACYFILGKAWDAKQNYTQAQYAFQQIVDHYALAQIWDPKGWFWSPVEAVTADFIQRDPMHYAKLQNVFSNYSSS